MNKSNLLIRNLVSKTNVAIFCAIGMVCTFLVSRAVLSCFVFVFGFNAIRDINPKNWKKDIWWIMGVIWFLMYALSFFWTMDTDNWHTRVEVKLPVLLLPLAFYFLPAFNRKQIQWFVLCSALLVLGSVAYSISFFIKDPSYYSEQYVYSHVLPTLVYGDHIRYSLFVALYIVWLASVFNDLGQKWMKAFVVITIVLLSVYLHILAARTGLIVWYIFVASWCLRFSFKKNMKLGVAIIFLLIVSSAMAIKYIPTLEKRVWYMRHTYELYTSGKAQSGYSDMGRLISYSIASKLIANNAIIGVGAGDILFEMNKGYDRWQPDVPQEYRLIPHNQFMIVCLGCGVLTLLVFILWVFWPLVWIRKSPKGFHLFIIWISLFLAMMVEPMLEVQFGVFVYLFFLLWSKHTAVISN